MHPKSCVTSSLWTLFGNKEPERIAVRFNNKEYVTVLDDAGVYMEVWSLDENGELLKMERRTIADPELQDSLENFIKG